MRFLRFENIIVGVDDDRGILFPFEMDSINKNYSENDLKNYLLNEPNGRESLKLRSIGNSMEPLIKTGNCLQVKYTPIKNIKSGDIISYVKNNTLITHRAILKIKKSNYYRILEKGDNSIFSTIDDKSLLGKIVSINYSNGSLRTTTFLFILLSRLISYFTLFIYSIYFLVFYLPCLIFEWFNNKLSYKNTVKSFLNKKRYKKIKKVLAKTVSPFNWIVMNFYKLFYYEKQ